MSFWLYRKEIRDGDQNITPLKASNMQEAVEEVKRYLESSYLLAKNPRSWIGIFGQNEIFKIVQIIDVYDFNVNKIVRGYLEIIKDLEGKIEEEKDRKKYEELKERFGKNKQ